VVVVGLGAFMLAAALSPGPTAPWGGHHDFLLLAVITILLGIIAIARKERGHLALASAMVTVGAACFLLVTLFVGLFAVGALKLFAE
jgi:hypothetical protein